MINLGSVELPLSAATKTFALLAKKGAGKSYTAGVMEEEFFKNNIPFVVFDPIDVHWGLRFSKDGKKSGLPIVVFGVLSNADIQLNENMGVQIADAIVSTNISCVISTFGMSKKGQRKLITDFSEQLLRINNKPRHIFIEEAHEFVPQRIGPDMGRCFAAVEALVVMGRNRGLGVTLINQRAATLNKDVLTQIDTLLAFRNVAPQDRSALKEWVEVHSSDEDFDAFWKSLPSLPTGEGWIWSPEWLDKFERIKIRERMTLHPDRENMAEGFVMPQLQQTDVQDFIKSFTKKTTEKTDTGAEASKKQTESREDIRTVSQSFEKIIEEKDAELQALQEGLRKAQEKLKNIKLVLEGTYEPEVIANGDGSVYQMWLEKIGPSTSAGRILKLVKDKNGLRFSKAQIRTMVGISSKSSGLGSALSLLKRNDLIKEENGYIVINPNIL